MPVEQAQKIIEQGSGADPAFVGFADGAPRVSTKGFNPGDCHTVERFVKAHQRHCLKCGNPGKDAA